MTMTPFTGEGDAMTFAICGFAISGFLYVAYRLALPSPLPGLPYNEEASGRLFGDLKAMSKAKYRRQWVWNQPREHSAPVAQVFLFPFRRPSIVVTDYHEVVDICSRRHKEFDRGTRNRECVGFAAPNFHFTMETRDPRFHHQRALIRDLMAPRFLKEISAPRIYAKVAALVDLWDLKCEKAGGRPFPANQDLYLATLDIICSVAFSMEDERSSLRSEIQHVQSLQYDDDSSRVVDDPLEFSTAPLSPETEALLDLQKMVSVAQSSPFPTLAQMMALLKPKHARAQWNRHALIRRQTDRSLEKLALHGDGDCESALDQLLWREISGAKKEGRKPDVYSSNIRDEVLGYIMAGHDTTATTGSWWIKYMSRHQSVQDRLRRELRGAHSAAVLEGRWPTKDEICTTSIPYLDAVLEETLRYASIATLILRTATCDTHILGYPVPQGTDVILCLKGPSVTEPALPTTFPSSSSSSAAAEAMRLAADKDRGVPHWGDDVGEFRPERWLKMSMSMAGEDPATGVEGGDEGMRRREIFDANAGPTLAFAAGPRQCFGKRLACMQLKILMTILLWNFEFGDVGEALNDEEMVEMLVNVPKSCYAKLKRI